jgi:hypothetical protein
LIRHIIGKVLGHCHTTLLQAKWQEMGLIILEKEEKHYRGGSGMLQEARPVPQEPLVAPYFIVMVAHIWHFVHSYIVI